MKENKKREINYAGKQKLKIFRLRIKPLKQGRKFKPLCG